MLHPAAQLLRVLTAPHVRVTVMVIAVIARIVAETLLFSRESVGFGGNGVGKRQRLPACPFLMLIMGEGPIDRIAQQSDKLDIGKLSSRALGYQWMHQIVGRCVQRDQASRAELIGVGEARPIPGWASMVIEVEIVDLFAEWGERIGMLHHVIEERGGTALLRSDDRTEGSPRNRPVNVR